MSDQEQLPPGWTKNFSKSQNRQYYFNTVTGKSQWHIPESSSSLPTAKSTKRTAAQIENGDPRDEAAVAPASGPLQTAASNDTKRPRLMSNGKICIKLLRKMFTDACFYHRNDFHILCFPQSCENAE